MTEPRLFDSPGPRGFRRIIIGSIFSGVLLIAAACYAGMQLYAKGVLDAEEWLPFVTNPQLIRFLLLGLVHTLEVSAVALLLALALGISLGVGRLSHIAPIRMLCTMVVEIARGIPVLLNMLFLFLVPPILFGIDVPPFWTVVLALMIYNGAVIAEIVRAGILALPSGQREAALSIGLRWGQTMRLILLPQALRIMLPALVSELVILIKDSALGFIVTYQELTAQGQAAALLFNNPLQTFVVVGLVYILINSALSEVSTYLSERRERVYRREHAAAASVNAPSATDPAPRKSSRNE